MPFTKFFKANPKRKITANIIKTFLYSFVFLIAIEIISSIRIINTIKIKAINIGFLNRLIRSKKTPKVPSPI